MDKFYQLLRPTKHVDVWGKDTYWVEAMPDDLSKHVQYLHSDGKVKEGTLYVGTPATTCDFVSEDKAYLAINDYYVAHGQVIPFVRRQGHWYVTDTHDYGQTSPTVVDSNESQPMDFE